MRPPPIRAASVVVVVVSHFKIASTACDHEVRGSEERRRNKVLTLLHALLWLFVCLCARLSTATVVQPCVVNPIRGPRPILPLICPPFFFNAERGGVVGVGACWSSQDGNRASPEDLRDMIPFVSIFYVFPQCWRVLLQEFREHVGPPAGYLSKHVSSVVCRDAG